MTMTRMVIVAACLWLMTATAHADGVLDAIAQKKVLDLADIKALAAAVRDWKPKDAFDPEPTWPSVDSKHFLVTLKPGQQCSFLFHTSADWHYDRKNRKLTVTFAPEKKYLTPIAIPDEARPVGGTMLDYDFAFRVLSCNLVSSDTYEASNALGMKVKVLSIVADIVAFGFFIVKDKARWPQGHGYKRMPAGPKWVLPLEPDTARKLVPNLKLVVSGVLNDWYKGHPVVCIRDYKKPTIDSPIERLEHQCFVNAAIARAELVDGRSGKVLGRVEINSLEGQRSL